MKRDKIRVGDKLAHLTRFSNLTDYAFIRQVALVNIVDTQTRADALLRMRNS